MEDNTIDKDGLPSDNTPTPSYEGTKPASKDTRGRSSAFKIVEEQPKIKPTIATGTGSNLDYGKFRAKLGEDFQLHKGEKYLVGKYNDIVQAEMKADAIKKSEEQGFFGELAAFGTQVASEIVLGAVEGAGYLMDWESFATKGEEDDWGNWLSDWAAETKEGINSAVPIHLHPDDKGRFAMDNTEWWFSNGVSIASALSIMIPVAGWAKGASMIGKAGKLLASGAKVGKYGSKAKDIAKLASKIANKSPKVANSTKKVADAVHKGVISRHIESSMEASGVYKEAYQNAIDQGVSDSEAKKAAAEGAAFSYRSNWAMALLDIHQYVMLGRGISPSKAINSMKLAKKAGKSPYKALAVAGKDYAKQFAEEGFEESYQFVVGEEGKHLAAVQAGLIDPNETTFADRMGSYAKDSELWTSAFFGGFGGMAMQFAGDVGKTDKVQNLKAKAGSIIGNKTGVTKYKSEVNSRIEEIKNRNKNISANLQALNQAVQAEDDKAVHTAKSRIAFDIAVNASQVGNLDLAIENLEDLKKATPEEMEEHGFDEGFQKDLDTYIASIKKVGEMYQKNSVKYSDTSVPLITYSQYMVDEMSAKTVELGNTIQELTDKIPSINNLTDTGKASFEANLKILSRERFIRSAEWKLENVEMPAEDKAKLEATIENHKNVVKESKESLADLNGKFLTSPDKIAINSVKGAYAEDLSKAISELQWAQHYQESYINDINYMTSKKGQKEMEEKRQSSIKESQKKEKAKDTQDKHALKKEELNNGLSQTEKDQVLQGATKNTMTDEQLDQLQGEISRNETSIEKFPDKIRQELADFKDRKSKGQVNLGRNPNSDHQAANNSAVAHVTVETPSNEEGDIVSEDNTETLNTTTQTTPLAWLSVNNSKHMSEEFNTAENRALTSFLEGNNSIDNVEVEFSINTEFINDQAEKGIEEYKIIKAAVESGTIPDELVGSIPIKGSLKRNGNNLMHNSVALSLSLHDTSFFDSTTNPEVAEAQVKEVEKVKREVLEAHFKGNKVSTTLEGKTGGSLNTARDANGNFVKNSISKELGKTAEEVTYLYGDSTDGYFNVDGSQNTDLIHLSSATPGAVYTVIKKANGESFPLRAHVNNLTMSEASIIYDVYVQVLGDATNYQKGLSDSLINKIKNHSDPVVKGLAEYLPLNSITHAELLNHLVFNGEAVTESKGESRLFIIPAKEVKGQKRPATLVYGTGTKKVDIDGLKSTEGKDLFINHLAKHRRRQVDVKKLGDKKYKEYLDNNGVLYTNAKATPEGNLFIQPVPVYSGNTKVTKAPIITKAASETNTVESIEGRRAATLNKISKIKGTQFSPGFSFYSQEYTAEGKHKKGYSFSTKLNNYSSEEAAKSAIIEQINAKYDAELVALDEATFAEEVPEWFGTNTDETIEEMLNNGPEDTSSTDIEIENITIDMSNYGKSYKQGNINEGNKSIIFNPTHATAKIDNGVITMNLDDVDGVTFYPIAVNVSNLKEYEDYKNKKQLLDEERVELRKSGEKGIEDMVRGKATSTALAKKKLLDLIYKELIKNNSISAYKGASPKQSITKAKSDLDTSINNTKNKGVPFFITTATKQGLADLGYTKQEISKLKPEEALDILEKGKINPEKVNTVSKLDVTFPDDLKKVLNKKIDQPLVSKENIEKARKEVLNNRERREDLAELPVSKSLGKQNLRKIILDLPVGQIFRKTETDLRTAENDYFATSTLYFKVIAPGVVVGLTGRGQIIDVNANKTSFNFKQFIDLLEGNVPTIQEINEGFDNQLLEVTDNTTTQKDNAQQDLFSQVEDLPSNIQTDLGEVIPTWNLEGRNDTQAHKAKSAFKASSADLFDGRSAFMGEGKVSTYENNDVIFDVNIRKEGNKEFAVIGVKTHEKGGRLSASGLVMDVTGKNVNNTALLGAFKSAVNKHIKANSKSGLFEAIEFGNYSNAIVDTFNNNYATLIRLSAPASKKKSGLSALGKKNKGKSAFKTYTPGTSISHTPNKKGHEAEIAHINSILPKEIATKLVPDYIGLLSQGKVIAGLFQNGMITVSEMSEAGTAYHEAFHAVFRTLLTEEQRDNLIAEAENEYAYPTERDITSTMEDVGVGRVEAIKIYFEEQIADDFMAYMANPKYANKHYKYSSGIKGLFQKLMDWISGVFSDKVKARKLFFDISRGKYAAKKPNITRSTAFSSRHASYTAEEVRETTKQMAYLAFKDVTSLDTIDKFNASNIVEGLTEQYGKAEELLEQDPTNAAAAEQMNRLEAIFTDDLKIQPFWIENVKDYIKTQFGLKEVTKIDNKEDNQETDEGMLSFLQSSYEVSGKESATETIKFLISMTPDIKEYKNGEPIYNTNTLLGLPKFNDFSSTYNSLENLLAGKTAIMKDGEVQDGYKVMVDALKTQSTYNPEFRFLLDKLEKMPEQIKTQFHFSFSRTKGNYINHIIAGKPKATISKIGASDINSKEYTIRGSWAAAFANKYTTLIEGKPVYSAEEIAKLKTAKTLLNKELIAAMGQKSMTPTLATAFGNVLTQLGVTISDKAITKLLYNQGLSIDMANPTFHQAKAIKILTNKLDKATRGLMDKAGTSLTNDTNLLLDEDTFFKNELAKVEGDFRKSGGESSFLGPDGNQIWAYQDNNSFSKTINEFKAGELTHLQDLQSSLWGRNSLWLNELLDPIKGAKSRENFTLDLYGNYKQEDVGDKGDKASNLKFSDTYIDQFNKQLSGRYIGLAEADKGQQSYFYGPALKRSSISLDPNTNKVAFTNSSPETLSILTGYLADELHRMEVARKTIYGQEATETSEEVLPLADDKQILYYHYYEVEPGKGKFGEKMDRIEGNAFKSFLFPTLHTTEAVEVDGVEIMQNKLEQLGLTDANGKLVPLSKEALDDNPAVKEFLSTSFIDLVRAEIGTAIETGLVSYNNGSLTNRLIDMNQLNDKGGDIFAVIGDYVLNSLIGNVEQTKMFNGDPALFKVKGINKVDNVNTQWADIDMFGDFRKRIPSTSASGKDFRIYNLPNGKPAVRSFYTSATIANIDGIGSEFFGTTEAVQPKGYKGLITPEKDTIFVFGSNPEGRHGAGAARVAVDKFGAKYGQGKGLQGNAYALPTKDLRITKDRGLKSISPVLITASVKEMYETARQNPGKTFKVGFTNTLNEVTLNGYSGAEMIAIFNDAGTVPSNVIFSETWVNSGKLTGLQSSTGKPQFNKENLERISKATKLPVSKLEELFKPYLDVNVTDAQAWITLPVYKERMLGLGKWSPAHEDAFDAMYDESLTPTSDQIKLLAMPLKTVHNELVKTNNDVMSLHYNKQSEAVLLPVITKGTQLENLRLAMEAEGGPDHVIVLDGKKAGGVGITDISDGNGNIISNPTFNSTKLSYRRLFLQQDLSTKGTKQTVVGSQGVKNVLSVVSPTEMYGELNGRELIDKYHDVISKLSDIGLNSYKKAIGYSEESGINTEALRKLLADEFAGEISDNHIEAILGGINLDALPISKKIQNKLHAMLTKKAVKLKQLGGAMVQLSDFGFVGTEVDMDTEVKKNIVWLKDPKERLQPMRIDEEGVVHPAQILMPHSYLAKELKKANIDISKMTPKQIMEVVPKEVLEGFSYRIPNQGPSSNDAFEIVGILPEEAGDTMVAYSAITTKTGSDFDIDKAFVILPNFGIDSKTGKVFYKKGDQKEGLENQRLEIMRDMLMHPSAYAAVMAPLDDPWLERLAAKIYPVKEKLKNLQFFTGNNQMKTKATFDSAKSLVGTIANHMTHHSLALSEGLHFNDYYLGKGVKVGNTIPAELSTQKEISKGSVPQRNSTSLSNKVDENGNDVANTLGAFMNAIVDAAKDPYITRSNINQFTANTAFMLARAGVSREWIVSFMGQPILKDLVAYTSDAEGKFAEKGRNEKGEIIKPLDVLLKDYDFKGNIHDMNMKFMEEIATTTEELQNNLTAEEVNKTEQIKILGQFLEWQKKAKQLNEVVKISKSDTDGATKNQGTAKLTENLLKKVIADNAVGNVDNLMGYDVVNGEAVFNGTRMTGTYFNNSVRAARMMYEGLFVSNSAAVENVTDLMTSLSGYVYLTPGAKNEEIDSAIKNELYALTATDTTAFSIASDIDSNSKYSEAQAGLHKLLFGNSEEESLANRLLEAKYGVHKDNTLINALEVRPGDKNTPGAIFLPKSEALKEAKDDLYLAWEELKTENHDLADDLMLYSFYASGMSKAIGSFYEHIPMKFLSEKHFSDQISHKIGEYTNPRALVERMDSVFKHLSNNDQLVPTVSDKVYFPMKTLDNKVNISPTVGFILTPEKGTNYVAGLDTKGNYVFKRFVKNKEGMLFQNAGTTEKGNAVYVRVNKLGYNSKGVVIKEYMGKTDKVSLFKENNVTLPADIMPYLNNTMPVNVPVSEYDDTASRKKKEEISSSEAVENLKFCINV